jgi:centractin
MDSISRVDLDLRKELYSNIVLSGGATLTKGFGDRLLQEIKRSTYKDINIKIFAPPERKYSTWIGGSILSSLSRASVYLGTFKKLWVTAEEYKEDPDIIHRKFLC